MIMPSKSGWTQNGRYAITVYRRMLKSYPVWVSLRVIAAMAVL